MTPLAVLGPTGYTGRLVCERARELGLPLRLVGRRREALDQLAREGDEVRVADARDQAALTAAFEGSFAVASLAGPFLDVGPAPVAAALAAGAHYLDTSGEQPFARLVYERFGDEAAQRGLVVLTSFGFDYVPGDLAARLAADGLEPLDEVIVAYSVKDVATSAGTRRTIGRVTAQQQVAYERGGLVPSRFGATTRRVRFPFGEKDVVEWGGTEPLTVPRHTAVENVRSYVRAPKAAARTAGLARLAAPLLRLSAVRGGGPSDERRRKTRFTVVAEARGRAGARRAVLTGADPYALTALLIVRGVETLRAGEARAAGALAPAEAFDARALAERLAPLLEIAAIDEL
ncbi:MAG: NAD(P)H-binding protein [Gaiellaceae bacterium]